MTILKNLITELLGDEPDFRKLKKTVDNSPAPQLLLLLYCQIFQLSFPEGGEKWKKLKIQFYTYYRSSLAIICHIPTGRNQETAGLNPPLPVMDKDILLYHIGASHREGAFGETPILQVGRWFHTHLELNIALKTVYNLLTSNT